MSNRPKIVDDGPAPCNSEQDEWREQAPTRSRLKARIDEKVEETIAFLESFQSGSFWTVEKKVISFMFALGRLFLAYFLALQHERSASETRGLDLQGFQVKRP